MKNITINSNYLAEIFQQLQLKLGGSLEINSKEYRLEIENKTASGTILGIAVENAISYLQFDIHFKEDISISIARLQTDILKFIYCSKGQFVQRDLHSDNEITLGQFQTGIFSNAANKNTPLFFKKKENVKFSIITVDVLSVSDKEFSSQLKKTFLADVENSEFSYTGSLNLKIYDKIRHLNTISQNGIVRSLLANSTIYHILALQIEQYKYDLSSSESTSNQLTSSEMEALKLISDFVRNNPEVPYSLKYLTKKSGLSPLKLQEGFKILHNRTVTDFIRNVRVEVAENLIRTSELNISEIVYSIGLNSRSYFSKIFKEKYSCCPKQYQNNLIMQV